MDAIVEKELGHFVTAAREAFGADLVSVVLFGSAAEDRLRATSDVNVIVVLERFQPAALAALRGPLALAQTAIRLQVMFVCRDELPEAASAFAIKFDDIRRRHRVLHGADPFAGQSVPRAAAVAQLRQALLNHLLRLRGQLASRGDREDRLVRAIADAAGPLRACAAELLELEGSPAANGREALERVAGRPLAELSAARETGMLPADRAEAVFVELLELCAAMRERARGLS